MNGDKAARKLTALAVLAVAVVAGIVASSLALLTEAWAQHPAPGLARAGLVLGVLATLAANVAAGVQFGIVGALVNVWPGIAFVVASEILLGMLRRARTDPTGESLPETVASVPAAVPLDVPEGVPVATISPAPVGTPGTVADVPRAVLPGVPLDTPVTPVSVPEDATESVPPSVPSLVPPVPPAAPLRRSPGRASAGKPKSPEKVFASELAAGQLPSLRSVKERCRVGTDKARTIRGQLAQVLQEAPEAA